MQRQKPTESLSVKSHFPEEIWRDIESDLSSTDLLRLSMTDKANFEAMRITMARKMLTDFTIKQVAILNEKTIFFLDSFGKVWLFIDGYESVGNEKNIRKKGIKCLNNLPPIEHIFKNKSSIVYFIDKNKEVWVYGYDPHNKFGFNLSRNDLKPTDEILQNANLIKITSLKGIEKVVNYNDYSFFLDTDGDVWKCGPGIPVEQPKKLVNKLTNIVDMVVDQKLYLIDAEGNVWTHYFYMGCGIFYNTHFETDKIKELSNISQVIAYGRIEYYIDQSGNVNIKIGNDISQFDGLPPIRQIIHEDKNDFRTVFIDEEDSVWVYGSNSEGCLGLGEIQYVNEPTKLLDLPPIKQVELTEHHTYMLDVSGKVYGYGVNIPRVINELPPIKKIISIEESIYFLDTQRNLWRINESNLEKLPFTRINFIECYRSIGLLHIDDDGYVYGHGDLKNVFYLNHAPLNLKQRHELNVIRSCHLTLNELFELANSDYGSDQRFLHAFLTALKQESKATQLYYFVECYRTQHKMLSIVAMDAEFLNILFHHEANENDTLFLTSLIQEEKNNYQIVSAFINLYHYLSNDLNNVKNSIYWEDRKNRYADFINLFVKLIENDIINKQGLDIYIQGTRYQFENKQLGFFTIPSFTHTYSSLRDNLLASINDTQESFTYFRLVVDVFKELYFKHLKKDECEKNIVVTIIKDDVSDVSKQKALLDQIVDETYSVSSYRRDF